jgi:N-acetylneuraminic acid mutarotase
MKLRLLFAFFALSLFITSCGSSDDLDGNWIKSSTFPGIERSGAVSFVLGDAVYVGTGFNGKDALQSFYKFTLAGDWEKITDFPGTARLKAVAFTANGKGYVGTGVDDEDNRLSDFYEFNPNEVTTDGTIVTEGTWTKVETVFPGTARQDAVAFSIGEIGYVGTGYGFLEGEDRSLLKDFFKFENGSWSKINFNGEKCRNATSFVIGGKAYIISGEGSGDDVWEYDPAIGFTAKKSLNKDNKWEDVQRSEAVSFVINNKGYVATGKNASYTSEVWEYVPSKDDWNEKTSLEFEVRSREGAVGFTLNNRGFFTTGQAGNYLSDMWEFNPTMKETDDDNN